MPAQTAQKFPGMLKYAAVVVVAVGLYAAREICIPVALAGLLCFLLSPVVTRLQRWHIPRVPAVLMVMVVFCTLLVTGAWLMIGQLLQMADQLPQYQETVHQKLQSLHSKPNGTFDRLNKTFDSYAREVESLASQPTSQPSTQSSSQPSSQSASQPGDGAASQPDLSALNPMRPPDTAAATSVTTQITAGTATQPQAIEVKIAQPRASGVQVLRNVIVKAFSPILTLGIVLILALFMLIQREDLRDRAIRLMGGSQLHVTTDAIDDAGHRVSLYLLWQLTVNLSFGICIWLGLTLIGIPYAPIWGAFAGILRFLPYFGVPAAAVPPILMSIVTQPGYLPIIFTLGLFIVLEITISYFIEPWLYGSKTGISPLAILVSALFWAWIWGAPGLLLSTPLTVCLAVIGRHIPGLRFLQVIFGDEPALRPEARLYQRLLSNDLEDAQEIAEEKVKATSLGEFYDSMLIPALVLAETNRHRGELDENREQIVFAGIRNLIDEMEEIDATARQKRLNSLGATEPQPHADHQRPLVLCMGANDPADELVARMLAGILRARQIDVRVTSAHTLSGESVSLVGELDPALVCISSVPPHAVLQARYLCKRLRAAHPNLKIVVGIWQSSEPEARTKERLPSSLADYFVTRVQDAAERIISQAAIETRLVHSH